MFYELDALSVGNVLCYIEHIYLSTCFGATLSICLSQLSLLLKVMPRRVVSR